MHSLKGLHSENKPDFKFKQSILLNMSCTLMLFKIDIFGYNVKFNELNKTAQWPIVTKVSIPRTPDPFLRDTL